MKVQELRNKIEQQKGKKAQIEKNLNNALVELKQKQRSLHQHEQAREIVREVGLKTQQSLQFHISDIVSLALDAVFFNPYELKVDFVQRRNKTECDLYFTRDGNNMDPLTASGVGAVDVAAFALRIASWSMANPRTRPVIMLDEPFTHLSQDLQEQASIMVKEISQKLGIQFIIITHEQVLASYADRVFETKIRKGITKITQS